jgi:Mg2+-importing ATPase
MVTFGLVSSVFDFITFAFLLLAARAAAGVFQTGWFVESLVTELAIVLVVRTRKAFWRSRPSALLSWLTLVVGLLAVDSPFLPGADWFSFVPLPLPVLGGIVEITLAYLAASEAMKHWFFARRRRG